MSNPDTVKAGRTKAIGEDEERAKQKTEGRKGRRVEVTVYLVLCKTTNTNIPLTRIYSTTPLSFVASCVWWVQYP